MRWVAWLTVASLIWNELRAEPSFYLLDTRFWELGAGVLLGYLSPTGPGHLHTPDHSVKRRSPQSREYLIAGMLLTVAAVLWFVSSYQLLPLTDAGVRRLDAAMAAQAAGMGVTYVSIVRQLCDAQGCRTLASRQHNARIRPDLLFRDRDHLTPDGSDVLIDASHGCFFPNLSPPALALRAR